MNRRINRKECGIVGYAVVYIDVPMYPEIERFIYTAKRTIYINLAAKPAANIIKLVQ